MKKLTLVQFKEEIEKIPEENVIVGEFTNGKNSCCIVGHYERLNSDNPNDYSENNCNDWGYKGKGSPIREISSKFLTPFNMDYSYDIADINNSRFKHYNQETPKQRSLAFINDMIAAGLEIK